MNTSNRTDMLTIAESVANAKGIDMEKVLEALEVAIEKAATYRYGDEFDIRTSIDRITGIVNLERYTAIVENTAENGMTQISLEEARRIWKKFWKL